VIEEVKEVLVNLKESATMWAMRSYEQYCAVAKALDVVGDRWTLLIVRELLVRHSCRYTDLQQGLPGIATNLLVDRLRRMEEAGIIQRFAAPPPVATTLYELTARGRDIRPVVEALGYWGAPLMRQRAESDEFRAHWLAFPIELGLEDGTPSAPPTAIEVRTGGDVLALQVDAGSIRTLPGPAARPDAVIAGAPDAILGVLLGHLTLAKARRRGVRLEGNVEAIRRLQPASTPTAT
jgi:DNA-binding HxlR family transcriptional regulator